MISIDIFINIGLYIIRYLMKSDNNTRQEKGKALAEKPNQIRRIDDNWYQVRSQSLKHESWYDVVQTETGFVCDCPDHQWRKVKCYHIYAVEFSQLIRNEVFRTVCIEELTTNKCIFCYSGNIIKRGIRKNKVGDLQRFYCNDCKRWFVFNIGFEKMRASPETITSALQLYFSGESLRNVCNFLKLQGNKVSHMTVYRWIKKYVNLMESYLENIPPTLGNKWRADELYLKVKGNTKYLYAMLDDQTRFWIAKQVADTKYTECVQPLFQNASKFAGAKPKVLVTDGAPNFAEAYRMEYLKEKLESPKHVRHIHFNNDRNNNKMERLNGEIRDREKVMRGLKNPDTPILTGYQIYHNYVRPHMALEGKTPADMAGIKVEGNNKWITLIQNAKKSQIVTGGTTCQ
ncbi:DDE-type integrase/transposase/recombinase [Candidatus Nitrosotenuis aquarius]|uniref:DDE-type integrase/transposase/recombinase n=1 Tax=Candidatus Nitrosotenuis aquarius TaxID=1846278 RepID=UPI001FE7D934|nr:DDE-type integrase/transposase/recombinase [Candidatus Nitrosotenuis aquarius]